MISNEKVSIYITTCNRVDRLKRAVDSVLNQDYKNIEVLICDDASTDDTKEYVNNLSKVDQRIKYFRNNSNKGACFTRNLGIFSATGKFITGLDDDDIFELNRISIFLKHWDDKYSFICCNFKNNNLGKITPNYLDEKEQVFSYKDNLYENKASNQIFTLTSRLQSIGGFDIRAKRLQDWDTWLRLSYKFGDFLRIPDMTYIMYHDHALDEPRVSNAYSYANALVDLRARNIEIYGKKDGFIMKCITDYHLKKLSFINTIKLFLITKKTKDFFRYFYQFYPK